MDETPGSIRAKGLAVSFGGHAWAVDPKSISQKLLLLLQKEEKLWKPRLYHLEKDQDVEIGGRGRDGAARWVLELSKVAGLAADSSFLALDIMDRFLHMVRAKSKYLKCIALSSLLLAAKLCEEDQCVPAISQLIEASDSSFTASDVLRMERVILEKLGWCLWGLPTPLDFLHVLHSLALDAHPTLLWALPQGLTRTPAFQMLRLIRRLKLAMADFRFLRFPPSMLALGALSLELQACAPTYHHALTSHLLTIMKAEKAASCLRAVQALLMEEKKVGHGKENSPPSAGTTESIQKGAKRRRQRRESRGISEKPAKRRLQDPEIAEDEIFDAIKNLYKLPEMMEIESEILIPIREPITLPPPSQTPVAILKCIKHLFGGEEEWPRVSSNKEPAMHRHHANGRRTYAEVLRTHLNIPMAALSV